jgi:putative GTP pyrophosphokinase
MVQLTKSQIDRLGEQLKLAAASGGEMDVAALDEFRLTYRTAILCVEAALKEHVPRVFTQRPAKSTASIVAKLVRQPKTRLSQIQDIAGIRYVVAHLTAQDFLCERLQEVFPDAKLVDRRVLPSFGYRAVHLIVPEDGKLVEIQVRTQFQHLWAQYSEALADRMGHELKYGAGDERVRAFLENLSEQIRVRETELHAQNTFLNPQQVQDEFEAMLPKPSPS